MLGLFVGSADAAAGKSIFSVSRFKSERQRGLHLTHRPLASALVLALALVSPKLATIGTAHAAENGGSVSGQIDLPPVESRKAAPKRGEGFVPRAKNPLRPPNGLDPRPEMVVVLEGGPVDEVDKKPRPARYNIVGENFPSQILPVVVGGKVEIKNLGTRAPRLFSKNQPEVVPSDPINRKGVRSTEAITELHKPIDIRDQDSVHFIAHIVAFEHSYFALPNFAGEFDIEGVPPGTWNVKVWYRDAWVTNLPETTITVSAKKSAKFKITLPAKLTTEASAQ